MRVGIIGIGGVGEACAHLFASRGRARSLVLANRDVRVANAVRMDLEQSRSWNTPLSARAVEPWRDEAFRGCEVLILTAGPRLRGDESRAAKASETARLLLGSAGKSIVESLARHALVDDGSILLVVTNPVEATVTWLAKKTGWNHSRIIGLGTTVETARFSRFLADTINVDAASVWTEIIGEHGPLIEIRDPDAVQRRIRELGGRQVDLEAVLKRTRGAASEIRKQSESVGAQQAERIIGAIETEFGAVAFSEAVRTALRARLSGALSPPATRFAIAAAALEVVDAIADDRGRALPVSNFPDFDGEPPVALALPFILGRSGVVRRGLEAPTALLQKAAISIAEQVQAMHAVAP